MESSLTPTETIEKIKEKAIQFAKSHATQNAKTFYELGKREAAAIFLAMVRQDGAVAAIKDVAAELLKHDSTQENAKWILENLT